MGDSRRNSGGAQEESLLSARAAGVRTVADELGGSVVESSRHGVLVLALPEFVTPANSCGVEWCGGCATMPITGSHVMFAFGNAAIVGNARTRVIAVAEPKTPPTAENLSSVRHSARHSLIASHTRVERLPFPRSIESPYRPPKSYDSGARYPTCDRIIPGSDFGQVQQLSQAMEIRCDGGTGRGEIMCGVSQL